MLTTQKLGALALLVATVIALSVAWIVLHKHRRVTITGAVMRQDPDPNKQLPIAGAHVTAITGTTASETTSDQLGQFTVTLPKGFRRRQTLTLQFQHPDYQRLQVEDFIGDKLYIARLMPTTELKKSSDLSPQQSITNVRVRYLVKATTTADVGSAVKTFEVVNNGNVPCKSSPPCSPDGKWKAAIASTEIDAGEGNEFRNIRVSCIAGPCPFTTIEKENVSNDGRYVALSARDWSDTATFLIEAEVAHPMISDLVRESYPVVFGSSLSFSLPVSAQGPSIEAEIDGEQLVFPLGPSLFLSWGQCTSSRNKDQTMVYRCELKPGYRFK